MIIHISMFFIPSPLNLSFAQLYVVNIAKPNCLMFNFSGGGLKEHTLEDVFSNLEEDMKEEAREVFVDSVERGLLVKNCISEVHEKV